MVPTIAPAFTLPTEAIDFVLIGTLFLKGTAVLVLVSVAAAALRRTSAGARHVVWSAGLAAILALPLLALVVPWRLEVFPSLVTVFPSNAPFEGRTAPSLTETRSPAASESFRVAEADSRPGGGPRAEPSAALNRSRSAETDAGSASSGAARSAGRAAGAEAERGGSAQDFSSGRRWSKAEVVLWSLFVTWVTGALVLLARVCGGALMVQRLTRRATALESSDWMTPLWEAADRLDLPRAPRLLMSDGVRLPFACGVIRPAIVVPASAAGWTDERRRAVLFHELGHVRRLDLLNHLVGRVACALYWFHPLVWLAARRARAESERACDDLVLSTGTRASAYAEHLLQIVSGAAKATAPVVAIPMAQRKEFEGRMVAILEPGVPRRGPNRLQAATLAGSVAVLALSVASMAPIQAEAARGVADTALRSGAAAASAEPPSGAAELLGRDRAFERVRVEGDTGTRTGMDVRGPGDVPGDAPADTDRVRRRGRSRGSRVSVDVDADLAKRISAEVSTTVGPVVAEVMSSIVDPTVGIAVDAAGVAAEQALTSVSLGIGRGRVSGRTQQHQAQDARAVAALAVALRDPVVDVRVAAAHTLGEIGDSAAVAALVDALRTDAVAEVRRTAAWALGEIRAPAAVPALSVAVVEDEDAEVRRQAAWALGEIEDVRAVEALGSATADSDPEVAKTAVWALGEIDSPDAAPYLAPALQSPHAEIRRQAVWALAETEAQAALEPMIAALNDEDAEVRSMAAWGLGELDDLRAVPALASALADGSPEVRSRAAWALGELEPSGAPDALSRALSDSNEEVRKKAAWALGEIADATSADALTAALADSSADVRRIALWALGEIGGPVAQEALLEAIRSEDPDIRRMAARALARTY